MASATTASRPTNRLVRERWPRTRPTAPRSRKLPSSISLIRKHEQVCPFPPVTEAPCLNRIHEPHPQKRVTQGRRRRRLPLLACQAPVWNLRCCSRGAAQRPRPRLSSRRCLPPRVREPPSAAELSSPKAATFSVGTDPFAPITSTLPTRGIVRSGVRQRPSPVPTHPRQRSRVPAHAMVAVARDSSGASRQRFQLAFNRDFFMKPHVTR